MICEKCKSELSYGTKYCGNCGEKVPKDAYKEEYEDTIWAKIDKIKDEYDTLLLKKITGNVYFKALWLIIVLVYFFFTMYGNLNGIRLMDSEAYRIQYYEKADEYYIRPTDEISQLELIAPIGTEKIIFTAFTDGEESDKKEFTTDEYKEKGYTVVSNEYDYIYIDAQRRGKSADKVKVIVKG